jgi:60 kDa SS-A/Ro ribonucleoprotein
MLVDGTLTNTQTWEAKLSAAGTEATSEEDKAGRKAAAWTELVKEGKLGYFALLRNPRNLLEQATDLVLPLAELPILSVLIPVVTPVFAI